MRDENLADWIEEAVAFPGSMVDRITPATSLEERDAIAAHLGVDDRWPVITEPFTQWIIEDSFCNERPPLDVVGAQFVPDVTPFETMKTRLLNGSHCALGYLGILAGYKTSDEVLVDPVYHDYLNCGSVRSAFRTASKIACCAAPPAINATTTRRSTSQRNCERAAWPTGRDVKRMATPTTKSTSA